jgi:AraC-like DNA-binding protein
LKYQERKPHPILEDTVRCFWTHEGTYSPDTTQSITPDGCVELIFNFGSPYRVLTATPPRELPAAVLVGFQEKTLPISVDGTVKVVAARFFAWGALALLADEIQARFGEVTNLSTGWDTLAERLREDVSHGRYDEARSALEEFLIRKALVRSYDPKLVRSAAKFLYHTKGKCRIEELADTCHASVRQIQRGFQQVVGTSPKLFARIVRFEQAQRQLMTNPETDLTGLGYECGYFDQAHFIKEFRAFTAKTPSEYAREMRHLQDFLKSDEVVFLKS